MIKKYLRDILKVKGQFGLMMEKMQSLSTYGKKKSILETDIPKGEWYMWEKIVDIEEVGDIDMVDIEVSGNHLFYGNDILTHNSSSDVGLEDTSESFGLPATADFMFAIISTEELEGLGQIMVKQLKNRYADLGSNRRFVVGVDRAKMRLYDVENEAQDNIMNDSSKPVMDNTLFGTQKNDRKVKFTKDKFEGFK